ncbi:copper resistance protein CopC [Nocardia vinacea]|uniref:copper resistance CopC family protein n=1 Tax=Nocardia vinacea TaxID=96468 RepID=UPI002E155E80|nr:copper resistance protein CopC [Nocardia vinacea]
MRARLRSGSFRLLTASLLRTVTVLAAVVTTLLLTAGPAAAHAALAGSDPADGARIDTAPPQVTLTFNEAIQESFTALTVTGPDGKPYTRSEPRAEGRNLSVNLDGLGPAGQYTVAFRVVSDDGHPIQGSYTFELTRATPSAPPTSAATPGATQPPTTENASSSNDSRDFPVWILAVAAAMIIAGGLAFVLRSTKSSNRR